MSELNTAATAQEFPGEPERPLVKCAYCGTEGPWRTHSGVFECGPCWDWRKLDGNAARYWLILTKMFMSAVDGYDLTSFFPRKVGLTAEEIHSLMTILGKLHSSTDAMATEHHTNEHWTGQAQELFDQLRNGIRPKPESTGGTDGQ